MQFQLPDLGEGITEAELVRWLVRPGEHIELDQEIVEVQTDKALVALPSPLAGTVQSLDVAEGEMIPVYTVLLTILEEREHDMQPVLAGVGTTASTNGRTPVTSNGHVMNGTGVRHVLATPVARKMAYELGIDITTLQGSGPAGRIRTEDVQRAAALLRSKNTVSGIHTAIKKQQVEPAIGPITERVPQPIIEPVTEPYNGVGDGVREGREIGERVRNADALGEEERVPLRSLRRRIAENMLRSVQTIPQVTSLIEVDASGLVVLRETLQAEAERQGVRLSYIPFIARALVQALKEHPAVNAMLDEERQEIVFKHVYHLGIATATPDGLLVPVIQHVDRLSLLEIAREVQRLSEQARARKLSTHELRGSTFTLTNYGSVGGFFSTPLINPGEAAILGLGKIVKRPWVVEDRLEVRPVLPLSFTADHRLIDGDIAMSFLNTLIALLEQPTRLMLTMH